jgi:basic amino acid/polyamine antiporter, APA family
MNQQTDDSARKLGFWMCVALVVGNMIGTGIFMLPASLAPYGLNSLWAWLLTVAGALFLAMCLSGLSRAFPKAEGPYAYTRLAFGDLTAFVGAWGYWVCLWVGNAAIATGATSYLSSLLPWIADVPGASAGTTIFFVWVLTAVNAYDIRAAGKVQILTTVLKLLPLLAVVGLTAALVFGDSSQLGNSEFLQTPFKLDSVTTAATLTLWAMLGFESASVMSSKVRDPERTIPLATMTGTLLTGTIYIVVCMAVMLLIPGEQLAHSNAPFAEVAGRFWGGAAAHWMALFVVISGLRCLNGNLLLQGELPFQMARKGEFPQIFAKESPRGTPAVSLYIGSTLITILVLMNYQKSMVEVFTFMILLATTANLVTYLLCALAVLVLLRNGKLATNSTKRTAGLAVAGVLGTAYALWTLYGAGKEAVLWGFVLLGVAVPVFYLMRSRRVASKPVSETP